MVVLAAALAGAALALGGALALGAMGKGPTSSAGIAASPRHATTLAPPAPTTSTTSRAEELRRLVAGVTLTPASGSKDQSWKRRVTLVATGSRLEAVAVVDASLGVHLAGAIGASGHKWSSTGALLPGATYAVSYEVAGPGGLTASGSGSFTTAAPAEAVTATVFPTPGIVVGIGQPIVFMFSRPVGTEAAQQAVLSHLHIAMSDPVPGGWHWFSSVELHFRPTSYWPVGEQVEASGDLEGWDIGAGAWGEGSLATSFVVGASHVSTVDLLTHRMTVSDNGRVVYDWPISAGAPQWPTMDGTHIVMDRESVVHMVSSTVGIPVSSPGGYDEYVYWDVHISDSGEYVHAAPWSVDEQGLVNVSHGCVNLSPQRAETFFRFSRVGDIVQVEDGPRPPTQGDHGVMDWSLGRAVVWTPAAVTKLALPVATLPTTTTPPPRGAPYFPSTLPPGAPPPGTLPPGAPLSPPRPR